MRELAGNHSFLNGGPEGTADVHYDELTRTWLLSTPGSAYALRERDGGGGLRHLYWGAPLSLADAVATAAPGHEILNFQQHQWYKDEPLEYVPFGGLRFDEPSLKAEFADGNRVIEWHVTGHRVQRDLGSVVLCIELRDDVYPLKIEVFYRVFDNRDVVERWATISNVGQDDAIVLRHAFSSDWWLGAGGPWRLRYLNGGWAGETHVRETVLVPGKFVLESRRGTTSHQHNPWFALGHDATVSEEGGEVWSGALAWSGSWKITFETTAAGRPHINGGWNDFDNPITLLPGGKVSLPVFVGCYSRTGFGGSSRAWHDYQRHHVLCGEARAPQTPSFPACEIRQPGPPPVRPVLYNSWEATGFAVDEPGQLHLAELAASVGAELFVLDDGWFSGRKTDHAGLGDWYADMAKFPRGLKALVSGVHQLGMDFGLWVEPEMVNPESDLYREHPDWVYHFNGRARSQARNQMVLNLARPDVSEWVFKTLDRLLSENDIQFVKWDMNRHISEPGWPEMVGNNPERVWLDHVRNVYDVLERLHIVHPGVTFESCSGGGGRVDLGILSRVEQVWTSDNTDAWDRLAIQEGFSQVYPASTMMAWVTDSPNPLTERRLPLRFRFHVAMAGSLGIGGDLARWTAEELAEASELVEQYKSVRHVVQRGALYRLASTRNGPIAAIQYVLDEPHGKCAEESVAFAWCGAREFGPYPPRVALSALDPLATYREMGTGRAFSGAYLMNFGLELPAQLDYLSMMVHLVRERD